MMSVTTEAESPSANIVTALLAEVDSFLATISHREIIGAGEVVDFALDLRAIIGQELN